jgi:hypothetical protein
MADFKVSDYDADGDCHINTSEAWKATQDSAAGIITEAQAQQVNDAYLSGENVCEAPVPPTDFKVSDYDLNGDCKIDSSEAWKATQDGAAGIITEAQAKQVNDAYLAGANVCVTPSAAKGELYDVFCPTSVLQGSSIDARFRVKNVGGSVGTFKVALYRGTTLVVQTSTWNQAAGTTSAELKLNTTAPGTGTSVTHTLKCMRGGVVDDTETCTIRLTQPTTAVTLEWIRDRYDADKDRYIDVSENWKAAQDYNAGRITTEQQKAVQSAYTNHTLLPAYPTNGGIDPDLTTPAVRSLEAGKYNIIVTKRDYNTVYATINVSSTGQVSCTDAVCLASGYPRVEASGTSVKVHMAATAVVSDACSWITSIGGWRNLQWTSHVLEAYYVYIGATGHSVGFSPVTWDDVLALYYYYIGDLSSAESKSGCGFT